LFIYVISAHEQGPCKIGFAKDCEKRLRQLQTGHPDRLHIRYREEFAPEQVRGIEKIIHETVRLQRQRGEWFSLSVADAILEVQFARIRHGDSGGASR
jgi:hypothetical protein